MSKDIKINYIKCFKCGHEWIPRKPSVYACPKCHSYKWWVKVQNKEEKKK